jgi:exosortase
VTTTYWARSRAGILIFWAASLILGWHVLVNTFLLSLRDDEFTYILFVAPVCAVLLCLDWRSLRPLITPNPGIGSVLLLGALLVACYARGWLMPLSSDVQLSLAMFALVLWWVGDFVLWFGTRASRLTLFPLCFLFGLVPLPRFALDAIVHQLQLGSAWTAYALFWAIRVPVDQSGVFLTIPGLTIHVAEECSSIRSSSILLATAIVLAQIMLRSPWRRVLLIGFAVPLSIAKNGLRIFIIGMLGTRVDPSYLTGRFHHQGGIVYFAIALIVMLGLLWTLRKAEECPLESGSPG